jgi:hypothetical protein
MTLETMCTQQARFIKQQTELIQHLRGEIERLTTEVGELKEKSYLKDILINEIFREHINSGGRAITLKHSRLVNDGTPIALCFEQIDNIDCTVLRAVR